MANTPSGRLANELTKIDDLVDGGRFSADLGHALERFEDAMNPDVASVSMENDKGRIKNYETGTRAEYLKNARICSKRGLELLQADADDVNEFMDEQIEVRELSRKTVSNYQAAATAFYRCFPDLDVDPDDVVVFHGESRSISPEDMYTESEVEAIRDACSKPRDRTLIEVLIYTGQRITAITTLQIKHVDTEKGVLYLNDEAEGLKGALDRGRKRPLFGSRRHLRDWINDYHPNGDDEEAPLFVGDPDHPNSDPESAWSQSAIRSQLNRIAEKADVGKEVNPHMFRHYFVTVMRREHEVNWETLKALLGASKRSDIPKTVYNHISTDEYIEKAERATGHREPETKQGSFTPDLCTACGQQLQSDWNRCPNCGEMYAPGLEDVREELGDVRETAVEKSIDPDTELTDGEQRAVKTILRAVDDPEALARKLDGGV